MDRDICKHGKKEKNENGLSVLMRNSHTIVVANLDIH